MITATAAIRYFNRASILKSFRPLAFAALAGAAGLFAPALRAVAPPTEPSHYLATA